MPKTARRVPHAGGGAEGVMLRPIGGSLTSVLAGRQGLSVGLALLFEIADVSPVHEEQQAIDRGKNGQPGKRD